jgi:type 1 glutamine amidotransferase
MAKNLILSGGVAHDYAKTSPMVQDILSEKGIESDIVTKMDLVEDGSLQQYDMLTLNCIRWTCSQPEVPEKWREEWTSYLSDSAKQNLLAFLNDGKGLLALHAATICFDDWPEFKEVLGAWWDWGHSGHSPFREHTFRVNTGAHKITEGINDFETVDELYTDPRITDSVSPLIEGEWEGKLHPMLWVREYGSARVCYNAFGHDHQAFENQTNRLLVQRCAAWVLGELS